ncbi:hypothetical protein L1987_21595 [Smallanthus sonchifolius]|uniref:Uncharacterized protein n=1 Tax=Smallanthus sonchifolius TaxID=185202 RepID=A0ACB9IWH0_9ASTR|nr:hypothetical protein L1987_21595 [Smallanthus sonchifolius]
MDNVHKETKSSSLRSEPPDPVEESKFWGSDESDTEERQNDEDLSDRMGKKTKADLKKGRNAPSRHLDGTMETALRRYGLRSDDTYTKSAIRNSTNRKAKSNKTNGLKQLAHPYHLDKENRPAEMINTTEVEFNGTPVPARDVAWNADDRDNAMQLESGEQVLGPVMVNMEDTGDSILANLSGEGTTNEEEMDAEEEVTSNQSSKSRSFTDGKADADDLNPLSKPLLTHVDGTQDNLSCSNTWVSFNENPTRILWPEWLARKVNLDSENLAWSEVLMATREKEGVVMSDGKEKSLVTTLDLTNWGEIDRPVNFFDGYGKLLDLLAKWMEGLMLKTLIARKKRKSDDRKGPCEAAKDKSTHHEDGIVYRKKKKRNKKHSDRTGKTSETDPKLQDPSYKNDAPGIPSRKKYKIWFSKNRKPEKNLSTMKVSFRSDPSLPKVINHPLGIDENMIESKATTNLNAITPPNNTMVSYASMLNGQTTNHGDDKIQFYPPLVTKDGSKMASEKKLETIVRKENPNGDPKPPGTVLHNMDSEGFTIVTRRKGGNRLMDTGETHRNYGQVPHNQNHGQRHKENQRSDPRGKEQIGGKGSVNKGVHVTTCEDIPESSSRKHSHWEQVRNPIISDSMGTEPGMKGNLDGTVIKEKKRNTRKPFVSVVETTNSFHLLDEDGNEIMDTIDTLGGTNNTNAIPPELNSGWIKKQERNLNSNYNQKVTKEQRYEAKKHVQDRLVPLSTVMSSWPTTQLEYFRGLCSLYNFGEGFLAASSDSYLGAGKEKTSISTQDEILEEVESETDGTAEFMKEDPPFPIQRMAWKMWW